MRLDHIAYRTFDRQAAAKFICEAFGYRIANEFQPPVEEGTVKCFALVPPEKPEVPDLPKYKQDSGEPMEFLIPWTFKDSCGAIPENNYQGAEYHMAPEIFISEGTPNSIVGKWVAERGGIGNIHHIAYMVDSVKDTMELWRKKGWAVFASEEELKCPDLTQVFTVPNPLTGVIYEFIERGKVGFCEDNVANLMESTKDFK